jgi:hypothetical protein
MHSGSGVAVTEGLAGRAVSVEWRRDRRFFTGMALAAALTVFAGFAPTYRSNGSLHHRLHGLRPTDLRARAPRVLLGRPVRDRLATAAPPDRRHRPLAGLCRMAGRLTGVRIARLAHRNGRPVALCDGILRRGAFGGREGGLDLVSPMPDLTEVVAKEIRG